MTHGRSGRLLIAILAMACALAALPAAPAKAAWRTVQAEAMKRTAPRGSIVKGRYAVGMTRGQLRVGVAVHAVDKVMVRASGTPCAASPALLLTVDGERVMERSVPAGGWKLIQARLDLDPGPHKVALSFVNPLRGKRCQRRLRIDSISFHEQVPIGTAVTWRHVSEDPGYAGALSDFDVLTPENEMKWEFLEPDPGRFEFGVPDQLVDFAAAHHLAVHAHTLIYDHQLPAWMLKRQRWAPGELEKVLEDYVRVVASHYAGRVQSWDVVNEPLDDWGNPDGFFMQRLGERYIEIALRAARAADPNAKLYINEIGADEINNKSNGLYALVQRLLAAGAPLDGVGFQYHTTVGSMAPKPTLVKRNLQRFADLGLEVAISEMDVRTSAGTGPLSDRLKDQARVYWQAADACAALPACSRFTVWGVADPFSWLGASEHALPLDSNFNGKLAWKAIVSALR
jgi:GH35 family endo-1,4-beta-xylanase